MNSNILNNERKGWYKNYGIHIQISKTSSDG